MSPRRWPQTDARFFAEHPTTTAHPRMRARARIHAQRMHARTHAPDPTPELQQSNRGIFAGGPRCDAKPSGEGGGGGGGAGENGSGGGGRGGGGGENEGENMILRHLLLVNPPPHIPPGQTSTRSRPPAATAVTWAPDRPRLPHRPCHIPMSSRPIRGPLPPQKAHSLDHANQI